MESRNEKSAQPDYSGLQHDPRADQPDYSGLQNVPEQDAPEVVSHSNDHMPVERRSSMNSPEVHNQKKNDYFSGTPGSRGTQGQEDGRAYYGQPPGYLGESEEQQAVKPKEKRVCGLRRKVFFWILAIVVLLIIIAAVLGGVLGTVLSGSKSKNTAPVAHTGPTSGNSSSLPSTSYLTGLAAIQPAGGSTLYQYYQDPSGRIIENKYASGEWSIQGDDVPGSAVVVSSAINGTPIAATSWSNNGATFRQIFYINEVGLVLTTNTTGTNTWSTPFNCLPTDSAAPDSIALAVVSDTDESALNGIRVYYASGSGQIQEVGIDFAETSTPGWNQWAEFPGSDPTSGVATVVSGTVNHLYLVNKTTGALQQWTWDYADAISWEMGATATTNSIRSGSDIAAVNDGHSTDYIFYQDSNTHLISSLYYGSGIGNSQNLGAVTETSKLTAAYNTSTSNEGALVYYQQSNSTSIGFQEVNRAGQVINRGTVG